MTLPDSSSVGPPTPPSAVKPVAVSRGKATPVAASPASPVTIPQSLLIALALLTLARLLFAAAIPLTEDETYYRLWSQHLQLGYYDHPPMIAWWIRAGILGFGDTSLGPRILPILASAATSLAIFDIAVVMGTGAVIARRAALWFQAMPMVALGGILATPDSPATLFWSLALSCLARTGKRNGAAWWLGAGTAIGLAMLSKYSALFLGPGILLWLFWSLENRKKLLSPWPWLAAFVALAIFSGNLFWNAEHQWLTFAKQFGRLATSHFAPGYLLELLLGQFLLLNPLVAPFAIRGFTAALRGRERTLPAAAALLVATIIPFALYLVFHATHDRVQAHWPTPLYPGLAILAAISAARTRHNSISHWMARAALPTGLIIGALGLIHLALPATDILGAGDPTTMVRGWLPFSKRIEAVTLAEHAGWIGTLAYSTAAELDNQAIQEPVVQLFERERYQRLDNSWRADLTMPGLVVDLKRRVSASALSKCFASVAQVGLITRGKSSGKQTDYAAFKVSGPLANVLRDGCPSG